MWFIGALGDLIASIIFCRKSVIKLWSEALKIIRFPRQISEKPRNIKLFCIMVGPCFVLSTLERIFFPTWSLSYPCTYWWVVPSTIATIVVPLILIKCDKTPANKAEITEKEAKTLGFVQLLAFLPGIGRFDAVFGAMRRLGYTCLHAFRCYILTSIPLSIMDCAVHAHSVVSSVSWWEEVNIFACTVVLIFSTACGYLILRFVELFWSKVSLTAWSVFCMITGILRMSYSAYFVFKYAEVIRLMPIFMP